MANYDVFNGDADGICALIQLRRAEPRAAKLVTGVKRDINLLANIKAGPGDHITVLDISLRTNKAGLVRALDAGAHVFYVDHHNSGDIPRRENLLCVIDTRPHMCTALLVNKCLQGAYEQWAMVGAFGDNMAASALEIAKGLEMSEGQIEQLKTFGELINYNAYGRKVSDLHFAPAALFARLCRYDTPGQCLAAEPDIFEKLQDGYRDDMGKAMASEFSQPGIVILADKPWARRISGAYGNVLASDNPARAHAVLSRNEQGGYVVSVRAPQDRPQGADTLCLQFKTGGGRAGARGLIICPRVICQPLETHFAEPFS